MSFNIFNFMNNNSQLSANSNCEIFNFGKNSQMQVERSNFNSQNPNEFSNNTQNFLFQAEPENDFNPENLLFQFNNSISNVNNITNPSQKSNSNFFSNNNAADFFNFAQFQYQNQNPEQDNNFNFKAGNYEAQMNQDFDASNRSTQMWQDKNSNLVPNYQDAYDNNNNCAEMQIENSVRINNNNNNCARKNSNNYLNGHLNNLSSSSTSTKSTKSLSYFKNNNTNKSPKHIVDSLKIINEAVENENNEDFGFLLQNQTPEKNKVINENAFENKFLYSNTKPIKEDLNSVCNDKQDPRQTLISDNTKANITTVKNNFDDRINLQTNSSSNLNNQIKAQTNLPVYNPNRAINPHKEENVLFRNKDKQIDLFASGNKTQEAEIKTDFMPKTTEASKDNTHNLHAKDNSNAMKNNLQTSSEEMKAIKSIEIQKFCEDLDTLENDLFSTLTFRKRNFFDSANPQSDEIMERIRLADIDELSKLFNYKGKEFKPDESDFHSVVNKNKYFNFSQGIRDRANNNNNQQQIIEALGKEAPDNVLNERAVKMHNAKPNEKGDKYQKFFDSQPPIKEANQVNNLSFADNINTNREEQKTLNKKAHDSSNNCRDKKDVIDRVPFDSNINRNKEIRIQKENLANNMAQASSKNKVIGENSFKPADIDFWNSNPTNNKKQIKTLKNQTSIKNSKDDEIKNKNNAANCEKISLLALEEEKNMKTKINSQNQEAKLKGNDFSSDTKPEEIRNILASSSSNNKIGKIDIEGKMVKKFPYNSHEKKDTFPIDQVTIPHSETLKNSLKKVYEVNISSLFAPMEDEEIEKLVSSHTTTSISNIFENKKSLVKYANDIMDNYCKLFFAVEKFRVNFKKHWEMYMLNYLMEVEYYNHILRKIDENHKFDLNKLETNVMNIAKKYQNNN